MYVYVCLSVCVFARSFASVCVCLSVCVCVFARLFIESAFLRTSLTVWECASVCLCVRARLGALLDVLCCEGTISKCSLKFPQDTDRRGRTGVCPIPASQEHRGMPVHPTHKHMIRSNP